MKILKGKKTIAAFLLGLFFFAVMTGGDTARAEKIAHSYDKGIYRGTMTGTSVGFIYNADTGNLDITGGNTGNDNALFFLREHVGATLSDGSVDNDFFWNISNNVRSVNITGDLISPSNKNAQNLGVFYTMFMDFHNLETVTGLSHLKGNGTTIGIAEMFVRCYAMRTVDLSEINLAKVDTWFRVVDNNPYLTKIIVGDQAVSHIQDHMWYHGGAYGISQYIDKYPNQEKGFFSDYASIEYLGVQEDGMRKLKAVKKNTHDVEFITDCDLKKKIPGTDITMAISGEQLTLSAGSGDIPGSLTAYISEDEGIKVSDIKKIVVSGNITLKGDMTKLFSGFENLTEITGLEKISCDSPAYSMKSMFKNCKKLESVELSGINLSEAADWTGIFENMTALKEINIGTQNLPEAFAKQDPFRGRVPAAFERLIDKYGSLYAVLCENQKITVSDDSSADDYVFELIKKNGTSEKVTVPANDSVRLSISDDTLLILGGRVSAESSPLQIKDLIDEMIKNSPEDAEKLKAVKKIEITGEISEDKDNSGNKNFCGMFSCDKDAEEGSGSDILSSIESISGLSNLKLNNDEDLSEMFSGMKSLKSVDMSGIDMSKVSGAEKMFAGCSSLTDIKTGGQKFPEESNPMPEDDEEGSPLAELARSEGSLNSLLERYDEIKLSDKKSEDGSNKFTAITKDGTEENLTANAGGKSVEERNAEKTKEDKDKDIKATPEEKNQGTSSNKGGQTETKASETPSSEITSKEDKLKDTGENANDSNTAAGTTENVKVISDDYPEDTSDPEDEVIDTEENISAGSQVLAGPQETVTTGTQGLWPKTYDETAGWPFALATVLISAGAGLVLYRKKKCA